MRADVAVAAYLTNCIASHTNKLYKILNSFTVCFLSHTQVNKMCMSVHHIVDGSAVELLVDPAAADARRVHPTTSGNFRPSNSQDANTLRLVIVSAQLHLYAFDLTFAVCQPGSSPRSSPDSAIFTFTSAAGDDLVSVAAALHRSSITNASTHNGGHHCCMIGSPT